MQNPCEPSDAPPGTLEKLLLMRRRAELCKPLHHPEDVKSEDEFEDRWTWLPLLTDDELFALTL